jgi:hypothetical protein
MMHKRKREEEKKSKSGKEYYAKNKDKMYNRQQQLKKSI